MGCHYHTHYSVLKLYAHNHQGVINGSMLFDTNGLKPTYIFKMGSPVVHLPLNWQKAMAYLRWCCTMLNKSWEAKKYKVDRLLNDLQENKNQLEHQQRRIV